MLGWLKRLFGLKNTEKRLGPVKRNSHGAAADPGPSGSLDYHSIEQPASPGRSDGFNESLAVGYLANDALLGGVVGGNLIGGMIGDMLNDSEEQTKSSEHHHHDFNDAEVGPASDFDAVSDQHGASDFESTGSDGSSFDAGGIGSIE